MAEKMKNLTLAELKKQNKKLNETEEHKLEVNGQEYKIKVDKHFRQTKQHNVLDSLVEFFNEAGSRPEILDLATSYSTLLIIREFTNLDIPEDIDDALDTMSVLIDLGLFGKIISVLPEDEVTKIYELLKLSIDRMNENITEAEKESDEILSKIDNVQALEVFKDGKE
jgi:hypothetical protein